MYARALTALLASIVAWTLSGDPLSPARSHYMLLEGSTLLRDCPACNGPLILWPLRGSFELVKIAENVLFSSYLVTNIVFTAGSGSPTYTVTGNGTFQIGGEVALRQEMKLFLTINGEAIEETNEVATVTRRWPMLAIDLVDAHPTIARAYYLTLAAAPVREIWFSTANGFTPADTATPRGHPGDLLSSAGHVVRSNAELISRFDFLSPLPEGNDAFDVGPGGEVFFSLNDSASSQRLGAIQHGDLLSERGERLYLNQQLVEEFGLTFNALDLGLDALTVRDDGEVLFSLTTDIESPRAGPLHHGDLLSNRGVIVKGFNELLAQFHTAGKNQLGLDALQVWPSGEVWFSTEDGFQDDLLGPVQPGDLLSDQGYIVFRNLELLAPFQPLEDLADFGLDGLFVVSDYGAHGEAPTLDIPEVSSESVHLSWQGNGRVFQLEKSDDLNAPWQPISPIFPRLEFDDKEFTPGSVTFYRLRQW